MRWWARLSSADRLTLVFALALVAMLLAGCSASRESARAEEHHAAVELVDVSRRSEATTERWTAPPEVVVVVREVLAPDGGVVERTRTERRPLPSDAGVAPVERVREARVEEQRDASMVVRTEEHGEERSEVELRAGPPWWAWLCAVIVIAGAAALAWRLR